MPGKKPGLRGEETAEARRVRGGAIHELPLQNCEQRPNLERCLFERVMGFEPTNNSLGSYCLTTWPHPRVLVIIPKVDDF